MRIERNINYFKNSDLPYQISIERNNSVLCESFESLKDAIEARDEIEQTFSITEELKHSSLYEDGMKALACKRFATNEVVKVESEDDSKHRYAAIAKCKECGKESKYIYVRFYRAFLDRDRLCQSCHMKTRTNEIAERLQNRKDPYCSNRTTGIKNICFDKTKNNFIVSIRRNSERYIAKFENLDRAIDRKEKVLQFYRQHNRLPNKDEI